MDLRDLFRPDGGTSRMTYRMVDSLIARLPRESAIKTELRNEISPQVLAALAAKPRTGHAFGPLSDSDWILLAICDRLDRNYRATYEANNWKVGEIPPHPRPGLLPPEPAGIPGDIRAQLEQIRADHLARQQAARAERAAAEQAASTAPIEVPAALTADDRAWVDGQLAITTDDHDEPSPGV